MARHALLAVIALAVLAHASAAGQTEVSELLMRQRSFSDGVIQLDSAAFDKYVGGRTRPYTVIVFSSAEHLMDKPGLGLRQLRKEFGYTSKAYKADAGARGKVFFAEIEFVRTPEVFKRLQTKSLPYIFAVRPPVTLESDGPIKLGSNDVMLEKDFPSYPWDANHMSDFVVRTAGLRGAKIVRPTLTNHWAFPVLVLTVLGTGGSVAYKLYYAPFMKHPAIWAFGILAVYLFSVSGGMHNIIRKVPMQHFDQRSGKVTVFLKTAQSQLGMEGFVMGTLFTTVGLAVALLTHGAPHFPEKAQRPLSFAVIVVAGLAYFKVKDLYVWKTGYVSRWYI